MHTEEERYDMEADIKSCTWMVEKVCGDRVYAQNLYAALCNNDFQRLEMWPILKAQSWSCSWRYAGGLVAEIRNEGDYMDWYCSGIRNWDEGEKSTPEEWANLTPEKQQHIKDTEAYAPEGTVADEIAVDLERIGWRVIELKET